MYIEREAKRARQAQLGPGAWGAVGTPGGPRLKIVGPEDASEYKGNSGLNGFHTPLVATKRRSTAGGVTVSAASAGAGGGSFLPPLGAGSRMRMPSPDGMEDAGVHGMAGSPGGVPDLHQLQMHRRKRRRQHTMPLRGAAAGPVAAGATPRQTSKVTSSQVGGLCLWPACGGKRATKLLWHLTTTASFSLFVFFPASPSLGRGLCS